MADFPTTIFEPRVVENLNGIVYDETKTQNLFAEDINSLANEVVAIENLILNKTSYLFKFDSIDGISFSGAPEWYGPPGVRVWTDGVGNIGSVRINSDNGRKFLDYTKDIIFEVVANIDYSDNCRFYFSLGYATFATFYRGFQFQIFETCLKVRWRDATRDILSADLGAVVAGFHKFKIIYSVTLDKLLAYVDDVLVYSVDNSGMISIDTDKNITLSAVSDNSGENVVQIESAKIIFS